MHAAAADSPDRSLFFQFVKVDAATREVAGVATAERPDKDGETLNYAASKPYFERWSSAFAKATYDPDNPGRLSLGNVRVMHDPKREGGKLTAIRFDDTRKQIEVVAKVIDDDAWKKCEAGVFTGFSIGGKYVGGRPLPGQTYTAAPTEISIVDNPALPEATFAYVKQDGSQELRKFTAEPTDPSIDQPAVTLTPESITKIASELRLQLAKDHETFQITPGAHGDPQLAGPGAATMIDTTGNRDRADQQAPRSDDDVFDEDEAAIQSLAWGVAEKGAGCPCADCVLERTLFATFPELLDKAAAQTYATHGGVRVPRGKHAYAPTGSAPSDWKYPIDTTGRVRNALSRWGQHTGIPAAAEPAVARRILAAARQHGVTVDPDHPIRAAAKKAARESNLGAGGSPATVQTDDRALARTAEERITMDVTVDQLQQMIADEIGKSAAAAEALAKGKKKVMADALGGIRKAHEDYHQAFMGHMDKVLKEVAHGDDPSNRPTDTNPVAAITTVGDAHPEQLAGGPDGTWKLTREEFTKSVSEAVAQAVAAAIPAVVGELGAAISGAPAGALGDRRQVVDVRKRVSDADRAQLDPRRAGAVEVTSPDAMRKALDGPDASAAILEAMKTVTPASVPETLQKSTLATALRR